MNVELGKLSGQWARIMINVKTNNINYLMG